MNRNENRFRTAFAVIGVLFALYAAIYIYHTSFVIDGTRYFTLFDDAMISMRYAKNLVAGEGLVMNPGERVEGFTNPLWVLNMVFLHLLPVSMAKISLLVQLAGALLHLATLWMVMKIVRVVSRDSLGVTVGAVLLTAFYLPLVSWSLQGMEVSLFAFVLTVAAYLSVRYLNTGTFSPRVFVLLGAGTLVRIDMGVPFVATGIFLFAFLPGHRKRVALWGLSLLIGFILFQTLVRLAYYGDILPNTYYLKMTGYPVLLRISRGLYVFWAFIWRMVPAIFLIPVLAMGKEYTPARGLLAWLFAAQCAYSIYVGGDAWEVWGGSNRYISAAMPLYFVLFSLGLDRLVRLVIRPFALLRGKEGVKPGFSSLFTFAALLLICGVLLNNNRGPLSLQGFVFREPPMNREGNSQMVFFALSIREVTTPDASIAVTWAGALPYFSERYTVDILGKTERNIAHIPMRRPPEDRKYTFFYPGHLKYDYDYSLGEKKPDVVFQLWNDMDEAEPYITENYVQIGLLRWYIFLRKDSPRIRWDMLTQG
ncbi:hypothetical protein ACFL5H_01735 [Candidatus Latescibacterota bacterium]